MLVPLCASSSSVVAEEVEFTAIIEVAVLLPSVVVTVTVALPGAIAVTTPLAFTVAILVLLELQLTLLFEAFDGLIDAVNVVVDPVFNAIADGVRVTSVTATTVLDNRDNRGANFSAIGGGGCDGSTSWCNTCY